MKKYQAGNRVTGVINNITDLGIFVTLNKTARDAKKEIEKLKQSLTED